MRAKEAGALALYRADLCLIPVNPYGTMSNRSDP